MTEDHRQIVYTVLRLERAIRESADAAYLLTGIKHRIVAGGQSFVEAATRTLDSWDERATMCSICRDIHVPDSRHPCE